MKEFWDRRYETDQFVYGREPNRFFATEIAKLSPGKILLPGEGEGRNAVHAASLGWNVDAFDQSRVGMEKALGLARETGVRINYTVSTLEEYSYESDQYDVVGLTFVHVIPALRKMLHRQVQRVLKPGGTIILEAFHISQLGNNTGGPPSIELLFDKEMLLKDFSSLEVLLLEEEPVFLNEGSSHQGETNIIRFLGRKIT
ncbi:MAG: class I SAM-dependent methyltransferase [Bacteroidales bacterium]|nr:class I SAM-dependent methyltransferase [Bacteroidales bacterium]